MFEGYLWPRLVDFCGAPLPFAVYLEKKLTLTASGQCFGKVPLTDFQVVLCQVLGISSEMVQRTNLSKLIGIGCCDGKQNRWFLRNRFYFTALASHCN